MKKISYLFELDCSENAYVATKVSIIPMLAHVFAEINLGRPIGPADGTANPGFRCGSFSVSSEVSLKGLFNGTSVGA